MELRTEKYLVQLEKWPKEGKYILAQYDEKSVIVYQAYRSSIGHFAAENKYFGGEFSLSRMSWIKPNFLWMMYRCGWATKEGQEVVLAIKMKREGFETILSNAIHSSFQNKLYQNQAEWQKALRHSDVRLQWDPDHDPMGNKQQRRAIQLGLSGKTLELYSKQWIIDITDISEFVREQRENIHREHCSKLVTPLEQIYPLDNELARQLRASYVEKMI